MSRLTCPPLTQQSISPFSQYKDFDSAGIGVHDPVLLHASFGVQDHFLPPVYLPVARREHFYHQ